MLARSTIVAHSFTVVVAVALIVVIALTTGVATRRCYKSFRQLKAPIEHHRPAEEEDQIEDCHARIVEVDHLPSGGSTVTPQSCSLSDHQTPARFYHYDFAKA